MFIKIFPPTVTTRLFDPMPLPMRIKGAGKTKYVGLVQLPQTHGGRTSSASTRLIREKAKSGFSRIPNTI